VGLILDVGLDKRLADFFNKCQVRLKEITKTYDSSNNDDDVLNLFISQDEKDIARNILNNSIQKNFNEDWNTSVVGLDEFKASMQKNLINPIIDPQSRMGGDNRRLAINILLYGSPGTGKTYVMKALTAHINNALKYHQSHRFKKAYMFTLKQSDIISKYVGDSAMRLQVIFRIARYYNKHGIICILFFDEVETYLTSRTNENADRSGVINQFLVEMTGDRAGKDSMGDDGLIITAATNLPQVLDDAAIRRFEIRQRFPMPTYSARISLFKYYLRNQVHNFCPGDYEILATISEGYNASDIKNVCEQAYVHYKEELKYFPFYKKMRMPEYGWFLTPILPKCDHVDYGNGNQIIAGTIKRDPSNPWTNSIIRPLTCYLDVASMMLNGIVKKSVSEDSIKSLNKWESSQR